MKKRQTIRTLFLSLVCTCIYTNSLIAQQHKTTTLSGSINVGSGQTYTSLTGAGGLFADINLNTVTGNITVNITSDLTEDGTNALNAFTESPVSSNYTLTIQPSSGTMKTISATAVATATPMININGADNISIDGRFGGTGQFLTFRNTNSTASNTGATLQFTNGSINSTIRNSILESNETSGSSGCIVVGNSGTNSISITSNDIRDATAGTLGLLINGVYSNSATNTVTISSNNIYNFNGKGIFLNNVSDGCSITDNSLYSTVTTTAGLTVISVRAGNNQTISGNYIGGTTSNAGGTAMTNSAASTFTGILTSGSTSVANSIQNNTIQNINITNTGFTGFIGINISTGIANIGTITGNTIGHTSNSNSILCAGSFGSSGIIISTTSGVTISNNLIANITCTGTTSNNSLNGILISSNTNNAISNNIIKKLSSAGAIVSTVSSRACIGISTTSSSTTQTITNNTIFSLTATNPTLDVCCVGIITYNASGIYTVSKNKIYDLNNNSSNAGASIFGIYIGSGFAIFTNNMVSITNGSNTNDLIIAGIAIKTTSAKSSTIYYNSIRIGGTSVGSTNTYGLWRDLFEPTMDVKNNIFINERTGGTGKHYAICNALTATGWSASASNYNVIYSTTSATTGYFTADRTFADFQTASGGEANSKNVDVVFADESNGDMHISGASIGSPNLNGVLIGTITEDYDQNTRPSVTGIPYIGADEVTASPLPIELIWFEGNAKTDFNLLTWATASEYNSDYIEIERLTKAKEFESIGSVKAAGISHDLKFYQFHDATFSISEKVNYYRLKMVDKNNFSKYSNTITISKNQSEQEIIYLYPNPSSDIINLQILNSELKSIKLKIINTIGQIVFEKNIETGNPNSINIEEIPAGLYTIEIVGLTENHNIKFLKN